MADTLLDNPSTSPRPAAVRRFLALAALVVLLAAPAGAGYDEGQRIELTGLVTDPAGHPMANLHVVLEASRSGAPAVRAPSTKMMAAMFPARICRSPLSVRLVSDRASVTASTHAALLRKSGMRSIGL